MGAGRKTKTFSLAEGVQHHSSTANCSAKARNLRKNDLGAVIFGCTHETIRECLSKQIFGLPIQHFSYIKNIELGLPLFLFNYSDRKLHGIFEAASHGKMNIHPYGWSADGSERTQYPAQVRTHIRMLYQPLSEKQYKPIISGNYFSEIHFRFELDRIQASQLISLFESSPVNRNSISGFNQNAPTCKPPPRRESEEVLQSVPRNDCAHSDHYLKMESGLPKNAFKWKDLFNADHDHAVRNEDQGFNPAVSDTETVIHVQQLEGCLKISEPQLSPSTTYVDEHSWNDQLSSSTTCVDEQVWNDQLSPSTTCVDEQSWNDQLSSFSTCVDKQSWNDQLSPSTTCVDEQSWIDDAVSQTLRESIDEPKSGVDELVLLIGGFDGISCLSDLDYYSPSTDIVKSLTPMNSARSYASSATLNGEIYVFGGGDGNSWYDTVESYNPLTNEWTARPSLTERKGSLEGVTLHNRIFAIGGGNGVESFSNVEMFDPALGKWIRTQSMLHKRFAPATEELNGVIYAVGGYDGNNYLKSAERFDPREVCWSPLRCMNTRRACHSLAVLNEKLYALGGYDGTQMVPTVEVYDPRIGSWMAGDEMDEPRGNSTAAVIGDSIYVIGGMCQNNLLDTVECYKEGEGWDVTNLKGVGNRSLFTAVVL